MIGMRDESVLLNYGTPTTSTNVVAIESHMLCRISGSRTHINGCPCLAIREAIAKEREEACQADRHTQEWQESMADEFPAIPARWHDGKIVFDFPN